jgi:hypothetical protein
MTEEEVIRFVSGLPGVDVVTAAESNGAPEVAWGDTFVSYDPQGDLPPERRMPFTTVVVTDYPGFDTESRLDRPGVFRVNVNVGRRVFAELFGHSPAAHAEHRSEYDFAVVDQFLPHPAYAVQGWASVLNPGPATEAELRRLITAAHARAVNRHRPH